MGGTLGAASSGTRLAPLTGGMILLTTSGGSAFYNAVLAATAVAQLSAYQSLMITVSLPAFFLINVLVGLPLYSAQSRHVMAQPDCNDGAIV
ncbi:sodium-dependent bicarbonate transport family permease [Aestuariirhabdus sp. Z084]|uniref:sodium-dependent bicarbonate transport family permease n=1 Tax=Aestuariirhabdus haliotis TaxID=2918751 RepID=UPI0020BEF649|nr:sodium-dependent bicarbonate transport family permease [Aestuariirhabdus haliotis]MCL6414105.1 sodium-dependent bicarbonate transport family permease [Aestuariirhabdus haliotis]MCL6418037.1 sodium-dependent bicarbonate transport family permease [Aestuariirhabdus haliotis]